MREIVLKTWKTVKLFTGILVLVFYEFESVWVDGTTLCVYANNCVIQNKTKKQKNKKKSSGMKEKTRKSIRIELKYLPTI